MAKVVKEGNRWLWKGTYDERLIAKEAGFIWDGLNKVWYTYDDGIANKLSSYMEKEIPPLEERITEETKLSYATDTAYLPPVPEGLSYHPYQRAGIEFIVGRTGVLLADQPGMGKTIQVAGALNALHEKDSVGKVLIVAPASMLLTWERELKKWLVWEANIHVFLPGVKKDIPLLGSHEISIFSYERLCTAYKSYYTIHTVSGSKKLVRGEDDVFKKYQTIILDEAHYIKSDDSKRSLVVSAFSEFAERRIFMTGTPMLNRPIELWTILHNIDHEKWDNRDKFATYFCNRHLQKVYYKAYNRYTGTYNATYKQVWVENGAEHIDELNNILRTSCMIRRRKEDVLTQLPEKMVQVMELPVSAKEVAEEMDAWHRMCASYGEEIALQKMMGQSSGIDLNEMAAIRQNVALAKVPHVCEIVRNFVEQGEKVILMAHHRAVVDELMRSLSEFNPVKVVGGMTAEDKQKSVDSFQNDVDTKVFVGNIRAAGVGITLTASRTVIFAELDFTPGIMEQGMDRAHRVGQKRAVNVYYVVIKDSLDGYLLDMLRQKENIAGHLLQ